MRSPGPPAHEAASAVPPVRRLSPPAHEAASAVPPVRSPGPPAHEEDQNKAFVRERVTFAHGRIVEPFSVARKDCGTLTGCVMALLSLARGVPFVLADRNRRLWIGFLISMVYISSKKLFLSYGTGVKIADFYVSL